MIKSVWIVFGLLVSFILRTPEVGANEQAHLKLIPGKKVSKSLDAADDRINCNFPEPTDVRDIARAFSFWTGKTYVVDERVKSKVRLISPEPVSKSEAVKRFHRMLARNNLEAVNTDGVVKIEAVE